MGPGAVQEISNGDPPNRLLSCHVVSISATQSSQAGYGIARPPKNSPGTQPFSIGRVNTHAESPRVSRSQTDIAGPRTPIFPRSFQSHARCVVAQQRDHNNPTCRMSEMTPPNSQPETHPHARDPIHETRSFDQRATTIESERTVANLAPRRTSVMIMASETGTRSDHKPNRNTTNFAICRLPGTPSAARYRPVQESLPCENANIHRIFSGPCARLRRLTHERACA